MSHTNTAVGAAKTPISAEAANDPVAVRAYRWMVLGRTFEDRLASLYRGGSITGGVYLGRGQEAFATAMAVYLEMGKDIYSPLIRDQAGRFAFGEPVIDAARTYLGSVKGPMRGRDGNIHRGRPEWGMPAMISHLGAQISMVGGWLMAKRQKGESGFVGATSIGDGGMSTGAFHEAMNFAAIEKLPLVLAVANNQFAYSTPNSRQFACRDLVDRAIGYGIEGHSIDGTDLATCLETFEKAISNAREGRGPQMVIGSLLRLSGHGEHDDATYVPESIKHSDLGQDCLAIARKQILDSGLASNAELVRLEKSAAKEVDEAVAQARVEPEPNPYEESWEALSTTHLIEGQGGEE